MSRKTIIGIVVVLTLLSVAGCLYLISKDIVVNDHNQNADSYLFAGQEPPVDIGEPETYGKYRPGDWDIYWNDEWKIGFSFPFSWTLQEEYNYSYAFDGRVKPIERINTLRKNLDSIFLSGFEGCSIKIERKGREIGSEWTRSSYSIGDYKAVVWLNPDGKSRVISLATSADIPKEHRVIFSIDSSLEEGRVICDQILSTVVFF